MKVADCWVYPVKSLPGVKMPTLSFDQKGPVNDRRYMLVDDKGKFITQRQKSVLSQVKLTSENRGYKLVSPDGYHHLRLDSVGVEGKLIKSTVWQDTLDLMDQGEDAARFFSRICDQAVRLVYQPLASKRPIDPAFDHANREVSLADGFPVLLINKASVDFLTGAFGDTIVPERFRANIMVTGFDAFEENTFRQVRIADQVFDVVKPCSRCVIPTIDPLTGVKDPKVWQLLKKHCLGDDGEIYFGQNLIPRTANSVSSGDTVTLI